MRWWAHRCRQSGPGWGLGRRPGWDQAAVIRQTRRQTGACGDRKSLLVLRLRQSYTRFSRPIRADFRTGGGARGAGRASLFTLPLTYSPHEKRACSNHQHPLQHPKSAIGATFKTARVLNPTEDMGRICLCVKMRQDGHFPTRRFFDDPLEVLPSLPWIALFAGICSQQGLPLFPPSVAGFSWSWVLVVDEPCQA